MRAWLVSSWRSKALYIGAIRPQFFCSPLRTPAEKSFADIRSGFVIANCQITIQADHRTAQQTIGKRLSHLVCKRENYFTCQYVSCFIERPRECCVTHAKLDDIIRSTLEAFQ